MQYRAVTDVLSRALPASYHLIYRFVCFLFHHFFQIRFLITSYFRPRLFYEAC